MARSPKNAYVVIFNTAATDEFFARSQECIKKIFLRRIFTSPNDEVALVLMGDDTKNHLNDQFPNNYQNIMETMKFMVPTWNHVRYVDTQVIQSKETGDWLDAVVVALDLIRKALETKKYSHITIALFSETLPEPFASDQLATIISSIEELGVLVSFIHAENDTGNDLVLPDSIEYMHTNLNQSQLHISTLHEAENLLKFIPKKTVSPRPWNQSLHFGTKFKIEVAAYLRVTEPSYIDSFKTGSIHTRPVGTDVSAPHSRPVGSDVSAQHGRPVGSDVSAQSETNVNQEPYRTVKETQYFQEDKKIDNLDLDTVIDGYSYGGTFVPYHGLFHIDYNTCEGLLTVVKFAPLSELYEEFLVGKQTYVVVPQKKYPVSVRKFNALVQAMEETQYVLVVRKQYNKSCAPKLNVLIPDRLESDDGSTLHPCFAMIELPFKEDLIQLEFGSLRGKANDDQLDKMEELIHAMSLGSGPIKLFPNPATQRMLNVITHRALHPNAPIPELSDEDEITSLLSIPKGILDSDGFKSFNIEDFKIVFPLEEIKRLTKQEQLLARLEKIEAKEKSDDDIYSPDFDNQNHASKVTTVDPAAEFDQLYNRGVKFETLAIEMNEALNTLIFDAFKLQVKKIIAAMIIYRERSKESNPCLYNEWVEQLKARLLEEGQQNTFVKLVVDEQLGFITSDENDQSARTAEEAFKLYDVSAPTTTYVPVVQIEDDGLELE